MQTNQISNDQNFIPVEAPRLQGIKVVGQLAGFSLIEQAAEKLMSANDNKGSRPVRRRASRR